MYIIKQLITVALFASLISFGCKEDEKTTYNRRPQQLFILLNSYTERYDSCDDFTTFNNLNNQCFIELEQYRNDTTTLTIAQRDSVVTAITSFLQTKAQKIAILQGEELILSSRTTPNIKQALDSCRSIADFFNISRQK